MSKTSIMQEKSCTKMSRELSRSGSHDVKVIDSCRRQNAVLTFDTNRTICLRVVQMALK